MEVDFTIKIDDSQTYEVVAGATIKVAYTLVGGDEDSKVDALAGGLWYAEVEKTDNESGNVLVTAPAENADKGKVLVYATNGKGKSDIRTLNFEGGVLTITAPTTTVPAEGAEIKVPVVTNVDYAVYLDTEAKTWISSAITKAGAVRRETIVLTMDENTTPEQRNGTVSLVDANGNTIQSISFTQESGTYVAPTFEDSSFKNYLLWTVYLDWDEDGVLSASEAARCTSLSISDRDFTSLAGIEALYNLKSFSWTDGSNSQLKSIDLSKNKKLESVTVAKGWSVPGSVEELILGDLPALTSVQLGNSSVKTLSMGKVPQLESFSAYNTGISKFDFSAAPELLSVATYGSPVESLDFSANPKLETITCGSSTLKEMNIQANTAIKSLNINGAAISSLDLSKLTELTSFAYENAQTKTINLSNSPKLTSFSVGRSSGTSQVLEVVDLRNSTKLSSVTLYSDALKEVILPKGTSTTSWDWTSYHMDPDTGYVTYVTVTEVEPEGGEEIGDYAELIQDSFVKKQILNKFDTDGNGKLSEAEAALVKEVDLDECGLSDGDLKGLENFPIEKLILSNNKFKSFDPTPFESLTWLNINNNQISSLNLPTTLLHVEAANNQIASISAPTYSAGTEYVDLSGNKLTSFALQYASKLKTVVLSDNQLSTLNLYGSYYVESVEAQNNKLTTFTGLSSLTALKTLNLANNQLSELAFGSQNALKTIDLSNNKFTQLNITSLIKSTALKLIDLTGNKDFSLLIIGGGNTLPDTIEIRGVKGYDILNATNPTSIKTNEWGYISEFNAGTGAEYGDITINYSLSSAGFRIEDGGEASITAKSGKKVLAFFAVATSGNPEINFTRSTDNPIYTADNDTSAYGDSFKATGTLPLDPSVNESAAKDWKKFIVDGNGDRVKYHFAKQWSSAGSTEEGEVITFTVTGGTAVIFGINLGSYRDDDE